MVELWDNLYMGPSPYGASASCKKCGQGKVDARVRGSQNCHRLGSWENACKTKKRVGTDSLFCRLLQEIVSGSQGS